MTARAWLAVAAIAVVVVGAVLLGRGPSRPSGPPSSSYATTPDGLAAYATLLERAGHDVRRIRAALDDRRPVRGETVVIVDGRLLPAGERAALRDFLRDGGHAVLAGTAALEAIGAGGPPRGEAPERRRVGHGEALLLTDATPLRNRALGTGDHAALGLQLAGPPARRVAFVESVHGYHERRGLAALPSRVRTCLWLLALAALVFLVARGRRLGPPESAARALPPPRRAHVEALAAALARTGDRGELLTARPAAAATTTTTRITETP
jgi:hypothetical protein